MSPTGSRAAGTAGFTLLELIVVLAIVALALALVPPNLIKGTDAQALKADLRLLVSSLHYARTRAISLNAPVALVIDPQTRHLSLDGTQQLGTLNAATDVAFLSGQKTWQSGTTAAIQFFPDGGSSGGDVLLYHDKTRYHVGVNWLTGAVTAARD